MYVIGYMFEYFKHTSAFRPRFLILSSIKRGYGKNKNFQVGNHLSCLHGSCTSLAYIKEFGDYLKVVYGILST